LASGYARCLRQVAAETWLAAVGAGNRGLHRRSGSDFRWAGNWGGCESGRIRCGRRLACGTCRNCNEGWTSPCLRANPSGQPGAGTATRRWARRKSSRASGSRLAGDSRAASPQSGGRSSWNGSITAVLNPLLLQKGIRSLVGVPLLADGTVLGVLHVGTLRDAVLMATMLCCSSWRPTGRRWPCSRCGRGRRLGHAGHGRASSSRG
jgi:hypothetical protein